ncbi:MAG: hypothetical protein ACREQ4_10825 [Candidatus Binataceae bacterium]
MSDANDKWANINQRLGKQLEGKNVGNKATEAELVPAPLTPVPPTIVEPQPQSIIEKFKAHQLERRLAAKQLQAYHVARLEDLKHQLKEAVRMRMAAATQAAEQFLYQLNQKHLGFMAELGLKNVDTRQKILMELSEQTARRLEEVGQREWPSRLKDEAIDQIFAMNQEFAERLRHEFGRTE